MKSLTFCDVVVILHISALKVILDSRGCSRVMRHNVPLFSCFFSFIFFFILFYGHTCKSTLILLKEYDSEFLQS